MYYPITSKHAQLRLAQRGFSLRDVEYIRLNGEWRLHRARWRDDRYVISLHKHNIPAEDLPEFDWLAGTVLILDELGHIVITLYRKRRNDPDIRKPALRIDAIIPRRRRCSFPRGNLRRRCNCSR